MVLLILIVDELFSYFGTEPVICVSVSVYLHPTDSSRIRFNGEAGIRIIDE
jgi:hypothetical protein